MHIALPPAPHVRTLFVARQSVQLPIS